MTAAPLTPYDDDCPAPSFAEFYASHYVRVLRLAMRFAGPGDAEEIAQETMVRAFESYERLDRGGDLWPWLAVVARNVGHDLARSRARLVCVEDVAEASLQAPIAHAPEALALARADERVLAEALGRLRPQDTAVLHLRDFEGLSFAAIGRELGMAENAARQLHHRARRHLAREFRRLGGGAAMLLPAAPSLLARLVSAVRHPTISAPRKWATAAPVAAGVVAAVVMAPAPEPGAKVPSAQPPRPPVLLPVIEVAVPQEAELRPVAVTAGVPPLRTPIAPPNQPHFDPPDRLHGLRELDPPGPGGPTGPNDITPPDPMHNVYAYHGTIRPWVEDDKPRVPDVCSVQPCER